MKLLNLQRRMARAVMTPLTPSERMRPAAPNGRSMRAVAAGFIKPNDRLTSFERLEIYNRQYWFRILSSFAEDFPGLRAVLGDKRFDAVAKAYLSACPSRSFTMRNLGSKLEGWLRQHPSVAGGRRKLALDMVRLEWAEINAFDGKTEPALKAEDLAAADASRLHLRLQPYIQLLDLRYPVDDLLLEVRDKEGNDFASNAFNEHRKRKRVQAVARMNAAEIFLAVHRLDYSVYFRRLEREEFVILSELHKGKTVSRAIDSAFRKSAIEAEDRPSHVERWFHDWAALGWFTSHARDASRVKGHAAAGVPAQA
jgi:hypothetical protein